jgi:pimeloyl-ACP methyl ester carboxylesterase
VTVRSDLGKRRAYGLVGLLLVLGLAACSLPSGDPDSTVITPVATPSVVATTEPTTSSTPTRAGTPSAGRPIQPIPRVLPNGITEPPPGNGMDRYRSQKLDWEPCGKGLTCSQIRAPLDYAEPDDAALTLALARRPATGSRRLGTLFINPGGPGGSGTAYVRYFDPAGLADYDIVGWDPRGVGASTPVACMGPADLDRYYALDASPDSPSEQRIRVAAVQAFGQSCLKRSGELLEHISTVETVRDLELLRHLVGDSRINYFGSSYGTRIGAVYAELYPARVGRMVLDGSVNISGEDTITQTEGFERALNNFAAWCAAESCRLGDSRAEVLRRVKSYLEQLDQRPVKVGSRMLTQQQGVEAVYYSMYGGRRSWGPLRDALVAAIFEDDAQGVLALGDRSNFRRDDGSYAQISYSFPAVRCLDSQDDSLREAQRRYDRVSKAAPVLGRLGGADLTCALWPVRSAPPQPTIDGNGAPPIVVIGTTGDPATPYEYAVDMADRLKSAVLVTYRGEGHLAFGSSECVNRLVIDYLVRDQVPPDNTRC